MQDHCHQAMRLPSGVRRKPLLHKDASLFLRSLVAHVALIVLLPYARTCVALVFQIAKQNPHGTTQLPLATFADYQRDGASSYKRFHTSTCCTGHVATRFRWLWTQGGGEGDRTKRHIARVILRASRGINGDVTESPRVGDQASEDGSNDAEQRDHASLQSVEGKSQAALKFRLDIP